MIEGPETTFQGLIAGFVESLARFPSRGALVVDGRSFSYEALGEVVARLAAAIDEHSPAGTALVAVLAQRSLTAYAGVLAALATGRGYVPLNPKFPGERLRQMLALSGTRVVIVGPEGLARLEEILHADIARTVVIGLDVDEWQTWRQRFPQHEFVSATAPAAGLTPAAVAPDSVAYLLFTSGSTGTPKGVAVRHRNVIPYVRYICDRYDVHEHDRFSQHFDLTFDLSVHDMFACWQRGACLYSVPEKALLGPARFIRDHELTMWFSVPSVAAFMLRMGMLKPAAFPKLRWSLFCGEPLPAASAAAWQRAAPNARVENLYGPTEATIAITHYRWDDRVSLDAYLNGIVPIGWPFDGQRTGVVDDAGRAVRPGEPGELVLGGSQVTGEYWNNPEKTAERFVRLPAVGEGTWYRTGDRVKQGADGCLYFLGRVDDQVKVRGYRVELQEVDHALRRACGAEEAVAIAWPVVNGSASGIVGFVCAESAGNEAEVLARCRLTLPDYMVPRRVLFVGELPRNANGKTDRKALAERLEGLGL